ncbi:glycoside hydrolase family 32 protein [Microbacterium sp.]|uniref:glycoside hydrolase family 32 protein n=1 Tax=Microbacterium sp. TaxID=51671 RepID=UPI0039E2BE3B
MDATTTLALPHVHFAPAQNWMNDPNGLVHVDGVYHLFFQYNPFGAEHAHMSWGHATSTDLLRWTEHGVAIPCRDDEEIYSGSAVVDTDNTSGLGAPGEAPIVAIYTSAARPSRLQRQSLAYSTDGGRTWQTYAHNPVLDRDSLEFRDPKVFRWTGGDDQYWVMVAVEAADRQVVLYRSDDLISWRLLSTFGPAAAVGGVWECPDLFPLAVDGDPNDVHWVLLVSLYPGGKAGGSATQYFIGTFDGTRFHCDAEPASDHDARWLDHGRDCYAGVTYSGLPDDERTLIAWMSNWDYARVTPAVPSRGAMTIPRRLSLTRGLDGTLRLRQEPRLPAALPAAEAFADIELDTPWLVPAALPEAALVELSVRFERAEGFAARIRHGEAGQDGVVIRVERGVLMVDRTQASGQWHPSLASVEVAPLTGDHRVDLRIVLDRSSIEVFADDGTTVVTELVYTEPGADAMTIEPLRGPALVESLSIVDLTAVGANAAQS